jgi:hypothetical protein
MARGSPTSAIVSAFVAYELETLSSPDGSPAWVELIGELRTARA